ncbi:MAG: thermonuclease family protein [Dehalococcoidia bacterium]
MPRRRRRRVRRPPPAASRTLPPFLRRRSNKWLIAAFAVLGLGLLLGQCFPGSGSDDATDATPTVAATAVARTTDEPARTGTPSSSLPDIAPEAALLERARVVDIIDGDTIDVELDGETERVRYYGIDTPERGEPCFGEASARNESLAGETVLLLPDARDRDRFDRLLRYVFAEDGASIDARMIAEGYAHAWTEDGAYRDQLIALEADAEAAGVGCLWE